MQITHHKKRISIPVKKISFFEKLFGLMFRRNTTQNLLFEFSVPVHLAIHSWFVFFPFLIIWLDKKNQVLEWRVVQPFSTAVWPKKTYQKFIEIPLNASNRRVIKFFVGKGKI